MADDPSSAEESRRRERLGGLFEHLFFDETFIDRLETDPESALREVGFEMDEEQMAASGVPGPRRSLKRLLASPPSPPSSSPSGWRRRRPSEWP